MFVIVVHIRPYVIIYIPFIKTIAVQPIFTSVAERVGGKYCNYPEEYTINARAFCGFRLWLCHLGLYTYIGIVIGQSGIYGTHVYVCKYTNAL